MSNPQARCHVCDRLPAAPEDWAGVEERGVRADRCYGLLGVDCASRRVDWRARALAAEAALRALVQAWHEGAEHPLTCSYRGGARPVPCNCWVSDVQPAVERACELIR